MYTYRWLAYFSLFSVLLGHPAISASQTDVNGQWLAFNRAGAPNTNLQCFTPGNVSVSNGNLVITTRLESATCSSFDIAQAAHGYTSGYVSMRSFNFLYGTIEFRAKFGGGSGTGAWPVVWMYDAPCQASDPTGTDDPCTGQEVDIAEILNSDFAHVNQQIHVNNFKHNDGCTASTTDVSQNFHVYQLIWSAGSLLFKIDGATTCTIRGSYIPNVPMYVKINTFVGNSGGPVKNSSLPWTTLVDYVKVTQGSAVVFNDDFNLNATVQPAQPAPPSSYHPPQTSASRILSRWPFRVLIVCLVFVIASAALKFGRSKRSGK
jgi:beta-glucanase (GH16 family)